jgi:hypothetical protein
MKAISKMRTRSHVLTNAEGMRRRLERVGDSQLHSES